MSYRSVVSVSHLGRVSISWSSDLVGTGELLIGPRVKPLTMGGCAPMNVPLFVPVGVDPVPLMGRGVAFLKVVQDLLA